MTKVLETASEVKNLSTDLVTIQPYAVFSTLKACESTARGKLEERNPG